jgi:glycosyltransferase involved in cell wall biosynthesis
VKAVFINHCHPEVTHVCGLRAGRLAAAMAARGHGIVLVTGPGPDGEDEIEVHDLADRLAAHDWKQPLRLACPPFNARMAVRAREGELAGGLRQAVIAWSYLTMGGMFPDWQAGVAPYLPVLANSFRPDVVWGTFGNTDTWKLCQHLARIADCPWVGDFKDNWQAFVPFGFRHLMARRLGNARAMTVLSAVHCDQADRLFPHISKAVLYSGVDAIAGTAARKSEGGLDLLLTGSIYDDATLARLAAAISSWTHRRGHGETVLRYAGNDAKRVRQAAERAGIRLHIEGYLPQPKLHALQASVSANIYVHDPRCLLHHKALELIAAGRPMIAFPGETDEVIGLAREAGTMLFTCPDASAVGHALDVIADDPPPVVDAGARANFTWEARAAVLEQVLAGAISGGAAA